MANHIGNNPENAALLAQMRQEMADQLEPINRQLQVTNAGMVALRLSQKRSDSIAEKNARQAEKNARQAEENARQIAIMQGKKKEFVKKTPISATKVIVKVGGKEIVFQAGRIVSKEAAKSASKIATKAIPIISLGVGIGFGIYRLCNGEYVKAGGEVASGLLACVPGPGTAASVALDLTMAVHDGYVAFHTEGDGVQVTGGGGVVIAGEITLEAAYEALGIDTTKHPNPDKSHVDNAFKNITFNLHPDRIQGQGGKYYTEAFGELTQFVTACKDKIYKERGWA